VEFEPFRIAAVSPLPFPTRKERVQELERAEYNVFRLRSNLITIDLVSDSGTGAMSQQQWQRMLLADESFAYQQSYDQLVATVKGITGLPYILPIHQGRAAENILFSSVIKRETRVYSNRLFSTTKAHLERFGAKPVELPVKGSGNIDLTRLRKRIGKGSIVILSLTSNYHGGQVVTLDNIEGVRDLLGRGGLLIIDGSRFVENAYRESKRLGIGLKKVIKKTFSLCDIFYLSTKKDLLTNIGGLIGVRDHELYQKLREELLLFEGFPTHGGLAGRDIAAITQAFQEITDERYLAFRLGQVRRLGERLKRAGVPVHEPFGCHAITIPAEEYAPGISYPGFSAAAQIYLDGGIRCGVFDEDGEVIRLAVPRRVYTESQLCHVSRIVTQTYRKGRFLHLLPIYKPRRLSNFLLRFKIR